MYTVPLSIPPPCCPVLRHVVENHYLNRRRNKQLKTLSQAGGFWGLLTLLNDVYLPMARPMYRALLAAISPGQAQAPAQTPPPPPPPPPPPRAPHAPPRHGPGKHHGESASRQPPENGAAERLDADPPSGGNSCCGTGGTGSDEKMACDGPADCGAPVVDGVAQDGMGGDRGSGFPAGEDAAAGANSSWVRPFDLVVLDMGSLGGLDFAQKMVREMAGAHVIGGARRGVCSFYFSEANSHVQADADFVAAGDNRVQD